eukprot:COSAG02_NODE_3073_length_7423_cov_10.177635_2_plen_332_part_00
MSTPDGAVDVAAPAWVLEEAEDIEAVARTILDGGGEAQLVLAHWRAHSRVLSESWRLAALECVLAAQEVLHRHRRSLSVSAEQSDVRSRVTRELRQMQLELEKPAKQEISEEKVRELVASTGHSERACRSQLKLCDGDVNRAAGRLLRLSAGEYFPERRVRQLFGQLLGAILHLKAHRIVHRDIKPDNIMLQSTAGGGERLVLIDFGQCLDCRLYELDGFQMPLPVNMPRGGAPGFLAPEVVTPRPGPRTRIDFGKNDDWAAGMLLYLLLVGPVAPPHNPFSSGDDPRHFIDAGYQPLDLRPGDYSEVLGDVARGLLRVDPAERMDAAVRC